MRLMMTAPRNRLGLLYAAYPCRSIVVELCRLSRGFRVCPVRRKEQSSADSTQGSGQELIKDAASGAAAIHEPARPLQRRIAFPARLQRDAAAVGFPQRDQPNPVARPIFR